MQKMQGKCLCGSVSVEAEISAEHACVEACHCSTCRKWGGGPLMAVECDGAVTWKGEANISVYASSEWAERGFCNTCGTHLFYRLQGTSFYAFPAGLLEGAEKLPFTSQGFIDEKPANYDFANKTKNLTGAEKFALFQQGQ